MADLNLSDLGHILDGVLERHPLTDKLQLQTVDARGAPVVIDLDSLLSPYVGKEVKLTLASLENLRRLQESLGDGEGVLGIMPEDIPGGIVHRTKLPS